MHISVEKDALTSRSLTLQRQTSKLLPCLVPTALPLQPTKKKRTLLLSASTVPPIIRLIVLNCTRQTQQVVIPQILRRRYPLAPNPLMLFPADIIYEEKVPKLVAPAPLPGHCVLHVRLYLALKPLTLRKSVRRPLPPKIL